MRPPTTSRRWRRSIPVVVDDRGLVFDAEVLDGDVDMHDGVYCAGCRVPATSVKAHPGRSGTAAVAAYFRIKHKGTRHAVGCGYDLDRQLALILKDAGPDVVTRERGLYRLHLPLAKEPERRPGETSSGGEQMHEVEWRVLSAAARIQQVLVGYQRHPEAAEEFIAEYKGREIGWGDFCWDVTQPPRAKELLAELRRPDWHQDWHPMAVWSWNTGKPVSDGGGGYRVTLTRAYEGGTVGRLRSDDAGVFQKLDPTDRCVMGYGRWQVREVGSPARAELALRVGHPSAVTSWPMSAWPPRQLMLRPYDQR